MYCARVDQDPARASCAFLSIAQRHGETYAEEQTHRVALPSQEHISSSANLRIQLLRVVGIAVGRGAA